MRVTLLLLLHQFLTVAYNLLLLGSHTKQDPSDDTHHRFMPQRFSYFGYSVILYSYKSIFPNGSSAHKSWIFVGAPKAQYAINAYHGNNRIPIEPGVTFRCPIFHDFFGHCEPLNVTNPDDEIGYINQVQQNTLIEKGHSWMGAATSLQEFTGLLTVCAPRAVVRIYNRSVHGYETTVHGVCYNGNVFYGNLYMDDKNLSTYSREYYITTRAEKTFFRQVSCTIVLHNVHGEKKAYDNHYYWKPNGNSANLMLQHVYRVARPGATPISEDQLTIEIPYKLHDSQFLSIVQKPRPAIYTMSGSDNVDISYLNCLTASVTCGQIVCKMVLLKPTHDVGKLHVKFVVNDSILPGGADEKIKIVQITTEASVEVLAPKMQSVVPGTGIIVPMTMTLHRFRSVKAVVSIWIILGSVLLGLLVLCLVAIALWKIGFFRRNKKEELDSLKTREDLHMHDVENSDEQSDVFI